MPEKAKTAEELARNLADLVRKVAVEQGSSALGGHVRAVVKDLLTK